MPVEVAVLGPLELRVDGSAVAVPGPRRRAVLALLAIARGEAVSVDRIIDALWDDDPPVSALNTVQSHVSRLRRHLGRHAGVLRRAAAGYRLRLDALDADQVEGLAADGRALRAADPAAAAARFEAALARWRGEALAEFVEVAPVAAEAARLAELRRTLTDDLLSAELAHRRPADVVPAATRAAASEPDREATQRLLMLTLARAGRPAEALDVAWTYHARVADRTGLDPTPELARLRAAIARGEFDPPVDDGARPVPQPTTPMVGRESELTELLALLASERCVTVAGPAGVGKTRLAGEAAATFAEQRPDPLWFVELAPVDDPDAVPRVVADALGVRGEGPVPHAIAEALGARPCLLVIDNCEHLVGAVRELCGQLLRRCARLTVATTSRVPLGLPGECMLRLEPLPLPDATDVIGGAAATAPPVVLFADRARRARSSFVLTDDNLVAVAEICRRLDGLPLALELAASRLAGLGLPDLRARLDAGLDFAVGGRRGATDRHATLRGAIGWSYGLLDANERRLFRALSVFPDRFELSGAEHVGSGLGLQPAVTLTGLVDASMVAATGVCGELSYRMLDSVRAFAGERLREHGELDAAVAAMTEWTTGFVARARQALATSDEPAWAARLERSWPTVRSARQHLLERGGTETVVARLHVDLEDFVFWRDRAEPWTWAIDDVDRPDLRGTPIEAGALATAAQAAWRLGDLDHARTLTDRALAAAGDDHGRALARFQHGVLRMFAGEHRTASRSMAAAGDLDRSRRALYRATAGLAAAYAGDADRSDGLLDGAELDAGGDAAPTLLAYLAYCRGEARAFTGDTSAAASLQRAVEMARSSGATYVVATAGLTLATVAARTGDLATACTHFAEVVRYWHRTGSWTQQWIALRNVAEVLARLGHDEDAAVLLFAADADADAPRVTGAGATRLAPLRGILVERLGPDRVDELRLCASAWSRTDIVERALTALAAAGSH